MKKISPIEKIAINSLKSGWGQLFLKANDGTPYGKFIAERPYPTNFWKQVDVWVSGFNERQKLKDDAISEKMIENESLKEHLSSLQVELERLTGVNKRLDLLLEDLTPGGSEFVNEPEYCAQWVKEQIAGIPSIIRQYKKENEALKEDNQILKEALQKIDAKSYGNTHWEDMQLINEIAKAALQQK